MNVKKIKEKLESLNAQGSKFNNSLWRPKLGTFQIRILPAKWDKEFPFKEIYFHYGVGNKTMLSLINFNESDPIVEFAEGLKAQEYTVENFKLAKKLEPKMRVFAPVIVRGEEDKGVRLWGFGKEVYQELCKIAEDEDTGDYTDIQSGRDIIVDITKQEGKQFNNTAVRVKIKSSPLSEDAKQVKEWLNNQPMPFEVFDRVEYADIKKALVEWLSPDTEEEEDEEDIAPAPKSFAKKDDGMGWGKVAPAPEIDEEEEEAKPTPKPARKQSYSLEGVKKKPSVDEQLKALFPEKK